MNCVAKIHMRLSLTSKAHGYFPTFFGLTCRGDDGDATLNNSLDGRGDDTGPYISDVRTERGWLKTDTSCDKLRDK